MFAGPGPQGRDRGAGDAGWGVGAPPGANNSAECSLFSTAGHRIVEKWIWKADGSVLRSR